MYLDNPTFTLLAFYSSFVAQHPELPTRLIQKRGDCSDGSAAWNTLSPGNSVTTGAPTHTSFTNTNQGFKNKKQKEIHLLPVSAVSYLPSKALSLAMTDSLNLIMSVVPLCQWAVTLAGKPLCVRMASRMPAVKAAQFKLLFSLGTEM